AAATSNRRQALESVADAAVGRGVTAKWVSHGEGASVSVEPITVRNGFRPRRSALARPNIKKSSCTGFGVVTVRVGGEAGFGASPGGAATPAGAAGGGRDWTTLWQAGDNSAAFPFRQSNNSGLVGAIHEQCAVKSFIVQACRTALS